MYASCVSAARAVVCENPADRLGDRAVGELEHAAEALPTSKRALADALISTHGGLANVWAVDPASGEMGSAFQVTEFAGQGSDAAQFVDDGDRAWRDGAPHR